MAGLDESQLLRDTLSEFMAELHDTLLDFAKAYPAVFRRGAAGYVEPPQDAASLRQERQLLLGLAGSNPLVSGFEQALSARIAATSFQETLKIFGNSRQQPGQGGG